MTARGLPAGGRYMPYPSTPALVARSPRMPVQSSNITAGSYVNVPNGYDCYNSLYGPPIARASYPAYPINYEDDMYNGQSPAYMLPNNNDSMLGNNIFGPPASPRTWDVFASSGRNQSGLYSDPNPPNPGSLPNGNFPGSGISFASNASDIPALLSGISTVGSNMTTLDRILPNPVVGRSPYPGLIMAGGNSVDGMSMSNVGYRSSVPWVGNDAMPGSSQSSDRVMSISFGSSVDSTGGSDASSATTQDATFAYVPIPPTSPTVSMKAAAAVLPDPNRSEIISKPNELPDAARARTISAESTASPDNPLPETYGYSGDTVIRRRSTRGSWSSGTLTNGQEYTRLRPLPPTSPELHRTSHHESPEYPSPISHRTSIASLSNQGNY